MTRRFTLSIFVSIIACISLFAQGTEEGNYSNSTHFITGIGGSYINVIDEGISPLLYNGIGGGIILGHSNESKKSIIQSSARFDFNNPGSSISNASMYTFRIEGMYQHYFKLKSQEAKKVKIFPGVSGLARWVLKEHLSYTNNSQHIETRFSIAPSVLIKWPFNLWGRDFETGIFSQLPLITYSTRPLFASTRFSGSVDKEIEFFDYVKEGEIISFGSYFRWSSQTYLYFPFKNGNGLRLDYFWMFESYDALNPVRTAEHGLMISTFLKL